MLWAILVLVWQPYKCYNDKGNANSKCCCYPSPLAIVKLTIKSPTKLNTSVYEFSVIQATSQRPFIGFLCTGVLDAMNPYNHFTIIILTGFCTFCTYLSQISHLEASSSLPLQTFTASSTTDHGRFVTSYVT